MAEATVEVKVSKGDYGWDFTFTVYKADLVTPYPITGGLVATLKAWRPGKVGTLKIDEVCTITDGAGGVCTYTVQAADFDTPLTYDAELEFTKAAFKESTEVFKFIVKDSP